MKKLSPESVVYIGTSIALDLVKGKNLDEIIQIKNVVNQISTTLSTICAQMACFKDDKK